MKRPFTLLIVLLLLVNVDIALALWLIFERSPLDAPQPLPSAAPYAPSSPLARPEEIKLPVNARK